MKQNILITSFQRLKWSVNSKITMCFALLVLLIFISSTLVFISILTLESDATAERQKSLEAADARTFAEHLQSQLTAYSDAIYLTQQRVINSTYSLQATDSLSRLKTDAPQQLSNPVSTLSKITYGYTEMSKVFVELNKLLSVGDITQSIQIWSNNLALRNNLTSLASNYQREVERESQQYIAESSFSSTFTKVTAVVVGLLGVIFASFFAWMLSGTIGKPLTLLRKYLEAMSAGDLSYNLHLRNRDELGDMAKALNVSLATLRGILESFNIGSQMEEAVKNLRTISTEQSAHASEQVVHVTQISTSMQELSSTAQSINENAAQVAAAAQTTLEQVQRVTTTTSEVSQMVQQLKQTVTTTGVSIVQANTDFAYLIERLNEVDEQSRSTEGIVSMITEIASETHLLSLNAAIEAAGAGEFGERFGIVARQVKELAARSSKAAEEIKTLIAGTRLSIRTARQQAEERQQSIGKVVSLGSEVGRVVQQVLQKVESNQQAVEAILEAAQQSTYKSSQIKSAAYEQQAASQQILVTVNNIIQVVNVGAEGSNEVAVTSAQLNDISRSLTARLAELKLPVALAA